MSTKNLNYYKTSIYYYGIWERKILKIINRPYNEQQGRIDGAYIVRIRESQRKLISDIYITR